MILIKKLLITVLIFFTLKTYGQYIYKDVDKQQISKYYLYKEYVKEVRDVYALKFLPKNYNTKGEVDYTNEIQKAIDSNSSIIFPNFPVLINEKGLNIPSNRKIVFQKKSIIIFKGSKTNKFQDILKITNVKNVELINIKIKGSRSFSNFPGEWSAGISILNSENIKVSNAYIYDTYGDGIFIGSDNGKFSKIIIENSWIDNARRNGISITSLINGTINNVFISNTNGTSPECGIDIEPSLNSELLKNVNISNIETFNNKAGALSINLTNLNSDNKLSDEVSISINRLNDNYSGNLVILSFNPLNKVNKVNGIVKLHNINGNNIKSYGLWKDSNKSNIKLEKYNFNYKKRNEN